MHIGHHNPPNAHMSLFDNDSNDNDNQEQECCCQRSKECTIETWTSTEEVTLWAIKLLEARLEAPGLKGHKRETLLKKTLGAKYNI